MKVYVMTDLEGVSGVWQWENREDQTVANWDYRMKARRLLTGEVNAAAAGFFDGGATEVIVNDGHGTGYSIDVELLDDRVTIIQGRQRPFWLPMLDSTCGATAVVGAHAKAGTPNANLCHSMSLEIRDYTFNGVSHGEIGMQAMIAGHYGVPMVFLAGDAHACREIEGFIPGVVTSAVKQGLSLFSAAALSPDKACECVYKGAHASMSKVGDIAPYTIPGPLTFRQECYAATWDPEAPPDLGTVIDAHTLEVQAEDIVDLFYKLYGYPR
jgi:D-amino peptidase